MSCFCCRWLSPFKIFENFDDLVYTTDAAHVFDDDGSLFSSHQAKQIDISKSGGDLDAGRVKTPGSNLEQRAFTIYPGLNGVRVKLDITLRSIIGVDLD